MSLDRGDIETLFESEKERLYALCLRITTRHDEAEDALSETWLAALQSMTSFRGEAKASSWLYRIAMRSAIRVRSKRRGASSLEHEPSGPAVTDPLVARETADELMTALDGLATEHRVALALSALRGLPTREIADILGIAEGTVWSRLHAARRALLAVLEPDSARS